jgi:hypothetical protein
MILLGSSLSVIRTHSLPMVCPQFSHMAEDPCPGLVDWPPVGRDQRLNLAGRRGVAVLLLAILLLVAACTPSPPPPPPPDGLIPAETWEQRQEEYLRHATRTLDRRSPESILAALARSRADDGFTVSGSEFTPGDLAGSFRTIDDNLDTSDFDLMRLWLLWREYRADLAPETAAALERRVLGFRYWYTDPLPVGEIDHKWFWSENHRLITHTLEYLAGSHLPDARFTVTGQPGRTHADRGRARLTTWLDEKARWGFSEWHSDVYYPEDVQALLLLSQYAEPALADRARALLDILFLDLAVNQVEGNFGVTHGRSYMKDKSRAADQNTRDIVHFLFDTNPDGYAPWVDFGTLLLSTSTSYRLPATIRGIATDPGPSLTRQRMGVAIDPGEPITPDPGPPPGTSYTDPAALEFWWDRGAMTVWQVVPLSLQAIREHELWRGDLFAPVEPLLRLSGDSSVEGAQHVAYALHCQLNPGLLTEVHTTTWRERTVMLSSAQDYRAGCLGRQYHAWQATLGADAVVFTTHPGNPDRGRWADDDLYWNGSASMPRTGQVGTVAINIYAPKFPSGGDGNPDANYQPFTHAFFPTQHFDEVRRVGAWTIGRKGDGYVALWSHRPTRWAPAARNPAGLDEPYDLLAPGGANNVWITEVGTAERWGDFDTFVAAIEEAKVDVVDFGSTDGIPRGYAVRYTSPSEGVLTYSSDDPLTDDDGPVDQRPPRRMDSPWVRVDHLDPRWVIEHAGGRWIVDVRTGRRVPS